MSDEVRENTEDCSNSLKSLRFFGTILRDADFMLEKCVTLFKPLYYYISFMFLIIQCNTDSLGKKSCIVLFVLTQNIAFYVI